MLVPHAAVALRSPRPSGAGRAGILFGTIIGIDPGHNGRNHCDPSFLNHLILSGRELETCDTTGTETDG